MADSQAGAPKDATTEQRGAVQAGAKRAAGKDVLVLFVA